jgi:hypothetical protein
MPAVGAYLVATAQRRSRARHCCRCKAARSQACGAAEWMHMMRWASPLPCWLPAGHRSQGFCERVWRTGRSGVYGIDGGVPVHLPFHQRHYSHALSIAPNLQQLILSVLLQRGCAFANSLHQHTFHELRSAWLQRSYELVPNAAISSICCQDQVGTHITRRR